MCSTGARGSPDRPRPLSAAFPLKCRAIISSTHALKVLLVGVLFAGRSQQIAQFGIPPELFRHICNVTECLGQLLDILILPRGNRD